MLKRIAPSEARLGMYIQSFDGRWLSHPFWRSRFHLTDPDDLRRVRESKVAAVVIDDAKGMYPSAPADMVGKSAAIATGPAPDRLSRTDAGSAHKAAELGHDTRSMLTRNVTPDSAQAERAEVVRVLAESAQAISKAFDGVAQGNPISIAGFARVIDGISDVMTKSRSTVIGLSHMKRKDEYTFYHSVAVGALMFGLARELGLAEDVVNDLTLGGLLHDVGKMRIADAILSKPGPLTSDEFAEIKRHTTLGHKILESSETIPPIALEVTLRHHERLDGSGYPDGLKGDHVSLYARIAAICDVFDALSSTRVYQEAMSVHDAIALMTGMEGQFDRDLLVAFMRSIGLYPAGLVVRLSSQRLAVMLPPGRHAGRPRARVFHCAVLNEPLAPCDVVISDNGRGESVLAEEQPANWSIENWPMLRATLLGEPVQRAA